MKILIKFLLCLFVFCFQLNASTILSNSIAPLSPLDYQAALLAESLGGSKYNAELQAFVPCNPQWVHQEWKKYKNLISSQIGDITPVLYEKESWKNSATTIEQLLQDAETYAPSFVQMAEQIASQTGSIANFGADNQHLIKSFDSLKRKVDSDMVEKGVDELTAISKIADAVRGTIITERAENTELIAELIKTYIASQGGSVAFKNYWVKERDSGYTAIHAKIFMPFGSDGEKDASKWILCELQIHLSYIMDGTDSCVKEREHLLYEHQRMADYDSSTLAAASQLLYLTKLQQYVEEVYEGTPLLEDAA